MGMVESRAAFAGAFAEVVLQDIVAKQDTPIWSSGLTNFAALFC
jgi:hypothetical protein